MRHFHHPAGQLATMSDDGWGTGGPIPFDPDRAAVEGWVEISEAKAISIANGWAEELKELEPVMAAWMGKLAAATRQARLDAITAAAQGARLTPQQGAAVLGEPLSLKDLGMDPMPEPPSAKRMHELLEAAKKVVKSRQPKRIKTTEAH